MRLCYGPFDVKDALSLSRFEEACRSGSWQGLLYPVDTVLLHMDALTVNEETETVLRAGGTVTLTDKELYVTSVYMSDDKPHQAYRRAYTSDGRFLGVLRLSPDKSKWQPAKIFR